MKNRYFDNMEHRSIAEIAISSCFDKSRLPRTCNISLIKRFTLAKSQCIINTVFDI